MHKLWASVSPHGILDNTCATSAVTDGSCRMVSHQGTLYCVYIDGPGNPGPIKCITRTSIADWGEPKTIGEVHSKFPPSIFVFNERLHLLIAGVFGKTLLMTLNPASGQFELDHWTDMNISETASAAVLSGRLHLFYQTPDGSNLLHRSTTDLKVWTKPVYVKSDGKNTARSWISPLAITYQGLIHLVYKEVDGDFRLIRFDGDSHWTRGSRLLADNFHHSPAGVVHNGLLKLLFSDKVGYPTYDIHQYAYDGNVLGPATISTELGAAKSVGAAVLDGVLHVLYRGQP
ncbi:hypothetical protein [Pseudomonas putida]|uniref:Uncharacterized protein n=1 Tax=Pseudomonas putida TaxID=303 RepID=A0A1Q9QUS8_PSEPU|nr:hypothetical protein [Pseudomonas putida]OLS58906.1 hypothetical protein PSEMO_62670 [Pseudomonas putida]